MTNMLSKKLFELLGYKKTAGRANAIPAVHLNKKRNSMHSAQNGYT